MSTANPMVTFAKSRRRAIDWTQWRSLFVGTLASWIVYLWTVGGPVGHIQNGDSQTLVAGAQQALNCIRDGVFMSCGRAPGSSLTAVGPYGLLQYLPASVLLELGVTPERTAQWLAHLNTVAFVATMATMWWVFQRHRNIAVLLCLALLGSAATYLATAAFGEMLAAFVILVAIAAILTDRRRTLWVFLALACLTRESAIPVVALLALASRIIAKRNGKSAPSVIFVASSLATGVTAAVSFNLFRYGSLLNEGYLDSALVVDKVSRQINYGLAIWLSPSGGVVWYWPLLTLILLIGLIGSIRRGRAEGIRSILPFGLLSCALVGMSAILGSWYSPFGWLAYGPRLVAPLLPAAVCIVAADHQDLLERALTTLGRHKVGLIAVAGICSLIGWPQFAAPWRHSEAIAAMIKPDSVCSSTTGYVIQTDPTGYHRCTEHVIWRTSQLPIAAAAVGGDGTSRAARYIAALATLFGVLSWATPQAKSTTSAKERQPHVSL